MKIAVVGANDIGLNTSILLARHNEVILVDNMPDTINPIYQKKSSVSNKYAEKYLPEMNLTNLTLVAAQNAANAFSAADMVVIAASSKPCGDGAVSDENDTADMDLEVVIPMAVSCNPNALIVIRTAVPAGYTESVRDNYGIKNIIYCPELMNESGQSCGILYPTRIVIGTDLSDKSLVNAACAFASMLMEDTDEINVETMLMEYADAEAVKLYGDGYLTLCAAFFKELDAFTRLKGLNTQQIIKGICLDPAIGNIYRHYSADFCASARQEQTQMDVVEDSYDRCLDDVIEKVCTRGLYRPNRKICYKGTIKKEID